MLEFLLYAALQGEEAKSLLPLLRAPYDRGGLAEYREYLEGLGDPLHVQGRLSSGCSRVG